MADASESNPIYTAKLVKSNGKKYNLDQITTDLILSHSENELSKKVDIGLVDIKVDSKSLHNIIALKDKVYVYADNGGGNKEVFRGYVWKKDVQVEFSGKEIKISSYDKLIYLMNSKDNLFFSKGKKTKDIISSIAKKWGVTIKFNYKSITHGKLAYRNNTIADIIIELLDKVKKKTGTPYVVHCEKGVMYIDTAGKNKTIYNIKSKENALTTKYSTTMDNMVTKVLIVGNEKKSGKAPNVATIKGNTKKYGTLQEIVTKSKDDKLSEAKKEANQILSEKGKPESSFTVTAVDNPYVNKGDRVYIQAGNLKNYYIVLSQEHDALKQIMTMDLKKDASSSSSKSSSSSDVAKPTLRKGSTGSEVKKLQNNLNALGITDSNGKKLTADGIFGINTFNALKKFQKKYNLSVDGVYGAKSYAKMKTLIK